MRINSNIHYFQTVLFDRYFCQSYLAYYTGCCINMLVRSRVWETFLLYNLPFHQLPQELLYLPRVQLDPSALLVRLLHERLVFHYHPVAEITSKKTSGNFIFNLWISKWKWLWGLAELTWSPLMPMSPLAPGKPSSPCGTLRNDNVMKAIRWKITVQHCNLSSVNPATHQQLTRTELYHLPSPLCYPLDP